MEAHYKQSRANISETLDKAGTQRNRELDADSPTPAPLSPQIRTGFKSKF